MTRNTGICGTGIRTVINMVVTSAYTCSFHLDQDFIITGNGNRDFTHFHLMRLYYNYFLHGILHFLSFPGNSLCPEKYPDSIYFHKLKSNHITLSGNQVRQQCG